MNCLAETPCNDEQYLDYLRDKQSSYGSGSSSTGGQSVAAEPSPLGPTPPSPPTGTTDATENDGDDNIDPSKGDQCTTSSDCATGFCNHGFCGECLENGTGCSVDQACRTAGCQLSQEWGVTKCFNIWELHRDCEEVFNEVGARCNTDLMVCERGQSVPGTGDDGQTQEKGSTHSGVSGGVAVHENPEGNQFFCGSTYYEILKVCLQSKPCPGGFGTG